MEAFGPYAITFLMYALAAPTPLMEPLRASVPESAKGLLVFARASWTVTEHRITLNPRAEHR